MSKAPKLRTPFYNPDLSYDQNYDQGPFGDFASEEIWQPKQPPRFQFLGQPLDFPFGIPAGPLLNRKFTHAAFRLGFPVATYKTVRRHAHPSHPYPNVMAVKLDGDLTIEKAQQPLIADTTYEQPLSITNSFGVPSQAPDVWQADLNLAVQDARPGQLLIGSFQGTSKGEGVEAFVEDCVETAVLVAQTGAKVLEMNLSCPNEGTSNLLCFDIDRVEQVVKAVKAKVPQPLVLKIAYFVDQAQLVEFVTRVGSLVEGLSAINTIPATVVDRTGQQALPGKGRAVSGVCGHAIKWAGLEMVQRLKELRAQHNLQFAIVGVGGVTTVADYQEYRQVGADLVMSATGAIWNPYLAQEIASTEGVV